VRVTAVVIDDHVLFRSGLRSLLERADVHVVGEASTAEAGLVLVQRNVPHVAILEPRLPRMSGHAAIRRIVAAAPHTNVLVLTSSATEADVLSAVLAGACGYLAKEASATEIELAVRAAACGETMISPRIAKSVLEHLRKERSGSDYTTLGELSAREQEVLRLVVDGKDNATIARELVISPYTVRNHVSNILVKLHAENRIQAAVCAVRNSLI
jgi:NarL family two-component system response regulator LiaR